MKKYNKILTEDKTLNRVQLSVETSVSSIIQEVKRLQQRVEELENAN